MDFRRLAVDDADRLKAMRVAATMESPASVYPTTQEELQRSTDELRLACELSRHVGQRRPMRDNYSVCLPLSLAAPQAPFEIFQQRPAQS
jgi:hypothetical protein